MENRMELNPNGGGSMARIDSKATGDRQARIACVGVGMIGHVHARIADQIKDCKLVAVSDTDPAKEKLAQAYHANFYADYREMIGKETLDGVIISLPNEFHEPVGSACAERGIHVFMEKPVAPTIEEADRLIDTVNKNNVQLLVGHHHPVSIQKTGIAPADPFIRQLKHFCRVAKGQAKPRTSGQDGRQTLRVTQAVLESGETHQPVNISPWPSISQ